MDPNPAWTDFMKGVRDRLTNAADRGRTYHQEKWVLHSIETLLHQAPGAQGVDAAGAIQAAEGLGWALANVDHVFIPTREKSRILTDSAFVHGNLIGIYLFRRAN